MREGELREREKTREWAGGEGDREQGGEREKYVCERDRDKSEEEK